MPVNAGTSSEPGSIMHRMAWSSFQALFWEMPTSLPKYTEENAFAGIDDQVAGQQPFG